MYRKLVPAVALLALCAAALSVPGLGLAAARGELGAAVRAESLVSAEQQRLAREEEVLRDLALRVAAGAVQLAEAADEAMGLLQPRKTFAHACECVWHVATPRQGAARHLIVKVGWLSEGDPAARAAVIERLEAEFGGMDPGPGW